VRVGTYSTLLKVDKVILLVQAPYGAMAAMVYLLLVPILYKAAEVAGLMEMVVAKVERVEYTELALLH
jgi:hypothetical protein